MKELKKYLEARFEAETQKWDEWRKDVYAAISVFCAVAAGLGTLTTVILVVTVHMLSSHMSAKVEANQTQPKNMATHEEMLTASTVGTGIGKSELLEEQLAEFFFDKRLNSNDKTVEQISRKARFYDFGAMLEYMYDDEAELEYDVLKAPMPKKAPTEYRIFFHAGVYSILVRTYVNKGFIAPFSSEVVVSDDKNLKVYRTRKHPSEDTARRLVTNIDIDHPKQPTCLFMMERNSFYELFNLICSGNLANPEGGDPFEGTGIIHD